MVKQKVVGLETDIVYYVGDASSCRRFINENSITVGSTKNKHSEHGFKEALRIIRKDGE